MSELWDELCTFEALKDGWYLASRDLQQDFIKIPFLKEQFALSLDSNLNELVRQLKTEQFRHQNVIRTAVKIKLIQQGINAFSPRIVQAVKYIERMQQEKLVSVEALASELELKPTKTLLFPDKQPEVST